MFKKIILIITAVFTLLTGTSVFACDCDDSNKIYEYGYWKNNTHIVDSICLNPSCDAPFTMHLREEKCRYTWEKQQIDAWNYRWIERCTLCGHIR